MGRFFVCMILSLMLLPAAGQPQAAQPVFFSLLFPQLVPGMQMERTVEPSIEAAKEEAVWL